MTERELTEIDVCIKRKTDDAILVTVAAEDGEPIDMWLPKSQIEGLAEDGPNEQTIEIPSWLWEKKQEELT